MSITAAVLDVPAENSCPSGHQGRQRYYRPELDALRFVAFLLVFLHHTLPQYEGVPGLSLAQRALMVLQLSGACGMTLFFVLSAFLLCEILLRERESTGRISVRRFYLRRILRIWPLYYLGLALGALVAYLIPAERSSIVHIVWFAGFLGAWYQSTYGLLANPATVLWSISVEEQFYAVVPWIAGFSRQAIAGFCGAAIAVSNLTLYFLGRAGAPGMSLRVWMCAPVQFEAFAAGILLSLLLRGKTPDLAAPTRLLLLFSGLGSWLLAITCCFRFAPHELSSGWAEAMAAYALFAAGACLVLLSFLGIRASFPGWWLYLGRISYGLYAFHIFGITAAHFLERSRCVIISTHFMQMAIAFALTVPAAALSYRFFERPFLQLKKRYTGIDTQPVPGVAD